MNTKARFSASTFCRVQIPLWSMNTMTWMTFSRMTMFRFLYGRWIQWLEWLFSRMTMFRFLYGRWIPGLRTWASSWYPVQIPLWSMNTKKPEKLKEEWGSSDSSMVDEYQLHRIQSLLQGTFRFLYGRWIHSNAQDFITISSCSDSSMVDEYALLFCDLRHAYFVQIPLWSMNTSFHSNMGIMLYRFRFLYGRWIQVLHRFGAVK